MKNQKEKATEKSPGKTVVKYKSGSPTEQKEMDTARELIESNNRLAHEMRWNRIYEKYVKPALQMYEAPLPETHTAPVIPVWVDDMSKEIEWKADQSKKIFYDIILFYKEKELFIFNPDQGDKKILFNEKKINPWLLSFFEVLESEKLIVNITGNQGVIKKHLERIEKIFEGVEITSLRKIYHDHTGKKSEQPRFTHSFVEIIRNEIKKIINSN